MRRLALVLDDNPDTCLGMESLLRGSCGLDVVLANTIAEAEDFLLSLPLDYCFPDMKLPDGSGVPFIRKVKAARPSCRVIACTANCTDEMERAAREAGADEYLVKPLTVDMVRRAVGQSDPTG